MLEKSYVPMLIFFLYFRSIARTDLDISYITSRVLVMPYPSEGLESAYKTNHIDDVRVRVDCGEFYGN